MNSGLALLWVVFSVIVGILYYRFMIVENPFRKTVAQDSLKFRELFKTLLGWTKRVIGGLLTSIFGYETGEQLDENTANTGLVEINGDGKWAWLEWVTIIVPISVYCLPFLNLGTSLNLPGSEAEYFQAFDQILEISVKKYGQFPLWNPYFFTGTPYIAHPMLHAFNPFISVPVLLFGVLDGFKIAVFLGFIIAGLGMWWLGREMGLSRVGRVWCALMFAFCGVPAAKFTQGHYLMVLGFGWIPFCLAAVVAATHRKKRKYVCIAALGMAMLFFCGNVYYAYYLLYVIAIYATVAVCTLKTKPLGLKFDWGQLKTLAAIGVLALGLIAIQLLPLLAFRDQYNKVINIGLSDSQSMKDVFLDFVSPEPFRPGAFSDSLRPEEFYAYVGWWPFLAMLFVPLTKFRKNKRQILLVLVLIFFTFLWIDLKDMPWKGIFQGSPLLYQFRYPSRMVVVGAMSLVLAGGLGLDALWTNVKELTIEGPGHKRQLSLTVAFLTLAICMFVILSVGNLALTSRPLLQASATAGARQQAMDWLRNFDPGIYYVDTPNNWNRAIIGNQMRYLNIWDAITVQTNFTNQISDRRIVAKPKYFVMPDDASPSADATLIKTFEGINLYGMTDSLPFAFTISPATLISSSKAELSTSEVAVATSISTRTNDIKVVASSDTTRVLVLLSSYAPDWQVTVDGRPAEIYNAYGFIATEIEPGLHHFVFTYQPVWFFAGLITSTVSLLVTICMLGANTAHAIIKARRRKSE